MTAWYTQSLDLHRYQSNGTAPAKPNSEEAEQGHVQAVGASLDLGQDLGVMLREAGRQGLSALLGFLARSAFES